MASFAALLAEALEALRVERPGSARRVGAALHGRAVEVVVDDERCVVRGFEGGAACGPASGPVDVTLSTDRATILRLVGGDLTLMSAVWSDLLRLVGRADDLVVFEEALAAFVEGAVRSPSFMGRWRTYREGE